MPDTYTPPQAVADNARRALEVRAEKPPSQRGMTPVGLARARQLSNRDPVSIDTIRRMVAYFDRHEVDKQGSTWDDRGKGWQAWQGWGGDEGRAWARRIMEAQMETKVSRRHSENDMKLIRSARKAIQSALDTMVALGDDGLEDAADAMPADAAPKSDPASPAKALRDFIRTGDAAAHKSTKAAECIDALNMVLASTVYLYYKAHAIHWNTEGINFPQFHEFFGDVYETVFEEIDPTAEYVRALGGKAPATISQLASMMPADLMTSEASTDDMLASFTLDNLLHIDRLSAAIMITGAYMEYAAQNYLMDRLGYHQKLKWQMSALRGEAEPMEPAEETEVEIETESPEPAAEMDSMDGMSAPEDVEEIVKGLARFLLGRNPSEVEG